MPRSWLHAAAQPSRQTAKRPPLRHARRTRELDSAYDGYATGRWPAEMWGGDEGTRTPNPCLAKAVLCQLSYVPRKPVQGTPSPVASRYPGLIKAPGE